MAPPSESNTAPTCFFESSVSFEMVARISDLVGAAFFFAILNLLLCLRTRVTNAPQFQLGAENNIEKSRCLAKLQKKIHVRRARGPSFSGIRADRPAVASLPSRGSQCFQACRTA